MDRTNASYGSSQLQYSTQNSTWRPQQPNRGTHGQGEYYGNHQPSTAVDIYALVDSWRSYRNDTTNLQTSTASSLNATAQSFEPSARRLQSTSANEALRSVHNYARYPNYRVNKSYRVSNGTKQHHAAETNHVPKNKNKQNKKSNRLTGIDQLILGSPLAQASQPVEPSANFASRYPIRSNRGLADQPLPSIEVPEPDSAPVFRTVPTKGPKSVVDHRSRTRTKSPVAPETTAEYRAQAEKEPVRLSQPRKLLVVLDLNGTLLYRSRTTNKAFMRPGVTPLIEYLFANHVVMVYTSATPVSATKMVTQFLHPNYRNQLAATWARDKLDLTKEQYANKVQVYKKLDKIWKDKAIQKTAGAGNTWDQSNTVLVDDSKLKALAQPHNLLQVPEYTPNDKQDQKIQQDILKQLEMKLEELKYQEDVSRLIRKWQSGGIEVPRLAGQEVVVEETVDQKTKASTASAKQVQPQPHLLTPDSIGDVSPRDGDSVERPVGVSDDEEDAGAPLSPASSTVSSIHENVFRDLLDGIGK